MEINIKDLNFSDEDIKLLLDGLEALPSRHVAGDMMLAMLDGMIEGNSPEAKERRQKAMQDRENKQKAETERLAEETIILRGKLLMFKRYLLQESALKQTNDIINKSSP